MATAKPKTIDIEPAADHLVTYAFEKQGLKEILSRVPDPGETGPVGLEYEGQLLKIITAGWSISYFMEAHPQKQALAETFWNGVRAFSQNLDTVTTMMTGANIEYFQTIRQRLETYLEAIRQQPEATDPAEIFGPTFARCCRAADNVHIIMAGNRIFNGVLQAIRDYLAIGAPHSS